MKLLSLKTEGSGTVIWRVNAGVNVSSHWRDWASGWGRKVWRLSLLVTMMSFESSNWEVPWVNQKSSRLFAVCDLIFKGFGCFPFLAICLTCVTPSTLSVLPLLFQLSCCARLTFPDPGLLARSRFLRSCLSLVFGYRRQCAWAETQVTPMPGGKDQSPPPESVSTHSPALPEQSTVGLSPARWVGLLCRQSCECREAAGQWGPRHCCQKFSAA